MIERARNVTSDRILRLPKLSDKTGRAPATIWKDVAEGILPPPVQIGPRAVGWRESEIDAWLDACSYTTRCKANAFDMKMFIAELIALKGTEASIKANRPLSAIQPKEAISASSGLAASQDVLDRQ